MTKNRIEGIPPKLLLLGPPSVTLAVFTQGVTDPVNVTKLLILGGLSFALVAAALSRASIKRLWTLQKIVTLVLLAFLASAIGALINSNAPFSQSIYGVYGRNNGFLLYLFLTFCFISVLTISKYSDFENLVKSLFLAGVVNVLYCFWVINFGDFVGWYNPYGNILGTLGNPNFIGAFLGMFASALMSAAIHFRRDRVRLGFIIFTLILSLFEIYKSNAIQGRVLFLAGLGINLMAYLWFFRKRIVLTSLAVFMGIIAGIFGVLGALQVGPLASLVYKDSVSLRGQYWYSGFQMGWHNFLHGVGFDAYGDMYRTYRRSSALVSPGVDTVSNTAHNVYLDIFAFGGIPLLLCYLTLNVAVVVAIIRVIRKREYYDVVFVSLAGAWICYQLQSIISINQIGLAIWGWILGASLIAYEKTFRVGLNRETNPSKKQLKNEVFTSSLRAGIGCILGLLVAVPPLAADMKMHSAQISKNASLVESALKITYMNPGNSFKFVNTVGLFHDSNLDELAHTYAQEAVDFNPQNFDSWRLFTYIRNASQEEKDLALKNMRQLDPLNPNLKIGSN